MSKNPGEKPWWAECNKKLNLKRCQGALGEASPDATKGLGCCPAALLNGFLNRSADGQIALSCLIGGTLSALQKRRLCGTADAARGAATVPVSQTANETASDPRAVCECVLRCVLIADCARNALHCRR